MDLWQTIALADLNGDGTNDLVMGNLDENFYLHPEKNAPVKLFLNDFDNNGQRDKIITRTVEGKDRPVFMKSELESQLPFLKKQNFRNAAYATKSVQELFSKELLEKALVKTVNSSASVIAYNNGQGNFTLQKMPESIQFSSVKAILPVDINKDGMIDLLMGGNEFGFQPQPGRLDASSGEVLINDKKGSFSVLGQIQTGFEMQGEVREIVAAKPNRQTNYLFLQNNEYPILIGYKKKNSKENK
jgi:hypothetical protein